MSRIKRLIIVVVCAAILLANLCYAENAAPIYDAAIGKLANYRDRSDVESALEGFSDIKSDYGKVALLKLYTEAILDIHDENFQAAVSILTILGKNDDFVVLLNGLNDEYYLPNCDELILYSNARISEDKGDYATAKSIYESIFGIWDTGSRYLFVCEQTGEGDSVLAPTIVIEDEAGEQDKDIQLQYSDIIMMLKEQGYSAVEDYALQFKGHTYILFDQFCMTWIEAEEFCEANKGRLVCINNQEEQTIIETLLGNGTLGMYWIGGYRTGNKSFAWVDGSAFEYSNWDKNNPPDNYRKVEDYLQILRTPNPKQKNSVAYSWNDAPVDNTIPNESFFTPENVGFVCEWSQESFRQMCKDIEDEEQVIESDLDGGNSNPSRDYLEKIPVEAIETLAFRTGPNTSYTELYSLPKETIVQAIEVEYGNGVPWVLLEWTYQGKVCRGYTGTKRLLSANGIPDALHLQETMALERNVVVYRDFAPFPMGIADNIGYYTDDDNKLRGNKYGGACFAGCRAGLTSLGIDSIGNVRGCESMYDDSFIEGNLRDKPLKEIWESPDAFAYNRRFVKTLLTGRCQICPKGPYCAGGCRSYNYFVHGMLYESPRCVRNCERT